MIYSRKILNAIKNSIEEYPVTLITGARQVGKSTIVAYFENKNYKYLTFDDTDLILEAKSNPKKFLEKYGTHLILDEIQRVKELFIEIENVVNKIKMLGGKLNATNFEH